jgi:glutathione S-transferase
VITLHGFGPFFGTPDSSPFVIKVMMLLKLAGVAYRDVRGNPFTAPRRLLPYLRDEDVTVADSTLIRLHLEKKYHLDFDAGLSAEQKATAWAVERMCEDHLYFAMLDMRWVDEANFNEGLGRHMFGPGPGAGSLHGQINAASNERQAASWTRHRPSRAIRYRGTRHPRCGSAGNNPRREAISDGRETLCGGCLCVRHRHLDPDATAQFSDPRGDAAACQSRRLS